MINTHWLQTFCTLVEVQHFTRTADRLFMTQSGVSQHIRKLEAYIGRPLLIRQGKQFTLTDAGKTLYAEAQTVLAGLSNLEQRVAADPFDRGRVHLMSPGSVGLKLYPRLLALQSKHPQLVIDYRFAPNQDIERAIAEGRVDLGLMTRQASDPDVRCTVVGEESLLLVTPASVKQPDWATLESLGFIDHPDAAHHAGLLLGENYPEFEHISRLAIKGFSNQIGLILEPVSRGLGFTVLPAHAVEAFHSPGMIRVHALDRPVRETLYLGTHRQQVQPKRVDTILREIQQWL